MFCFFFSFSDSSLEGYSLFHVVTLTFLINDFLVSLIYRWTNRRIGIYTHMLTCHGYVFDMYSRKNVVVGILLQVKRLV